MNQVLDDDHSIIIDNPDIIDDPEDIAAALSQHGWGEASALKRVILGDTRRLRQYAIDQGYLSVEQERKLFKAYFKNGDRQARDRLIISQINLAWTIATRYLGYGIPEERLKGQAIEALYEAIERFNPDKKTRYSTLVEFCVKQSVKNDILRMYGIPKNQYLETMFFALSGARSKIKAEKPDITAKEMEMALIAEFTKRTKHTIKPEHIAFLDAQHANMHISLNKRISHDGSLAEIIDFQASDELGPEKKSAKDQNDAFNKAFLNAAKLQMTQMQREIMEFMYPDDTDDDLPTFEKVGEHFGIQEETARQIHVELIKVLEKTRDTISLKTFDYENQQEPPPSMPLYLPTPAYEAASYVAKRVLKTEEFFLFSMIHLCGPDEGISLEDIAEGFGLKIGTKQDLDRVTELVLQKNNIYQNQYKYAQDPAFLADIKNNLAHSQGRVTRRRPDKTIDQKTADFLNQITSLSHWVAEDKTRPNRDAEENGLKIPKHDLHAVEREDDTVYAIYERARTSLGPLSLYVFATHCLYHEEERLTLPEIYRQIIKVNPGLSKQNIARLERKISLALDQARYQLEKELPENIAASGILNNTPTFNKIMSEEMPDVPKVRKCAILLSSPEKRNFYARAQKDLDPLELLALCMRDLVRPERKLNFEDIAGLASRTTEEAQEAYLRASEKMGATPDLLPVPQTAFLYSEDQASVEEEPKPENASPEVTSKTIYRHLKEIENNSTIAGLAKAVFETVSSGARGKNAKQGMELLALFEDDNLSYADLSNEFDIPLNSVRKSIFCARQILLEEFNTASENNTPKTSSPTAVLEMAESAMPEENTETPAPLPEAKPGTHTQNTSVPLARPASERAFVQESKPSFNLDKFAKIALATSHLPLATQELDPVRFCNSLNTLKDLCGIVTTDRKVFAVVGDDKPVFSTKKNRFFATINDERHIVQFLLKENGAAIRLIEGGFGVIDLNRFTNIQPPLSLQYA